MNQTLVEVTKNLINIIYPLHCAGCQKPLDPMNSLGVCSFCISQIKTNPKPYCVKCGRNVETNNRACPECAKSRFVFERSWSACVYDGIIKELIHKFKYNNKLSLADLLCSKLTDFVKDNIEIAENIDIVTYVPTYENILNRRDFNHSALLAEAVGKEFSLPALNTMKKNLRTRKQSELARRERLHNLSGAFGALDSFDGMNILIVDDVITTGSTLNECAGVLRLARASRVRCVTLARGL